MERAKFNELIKKKVKWYVKESKISPLYVRKRVAILKR